MSAETLRAAAKLMRERAEPCDSGPWVRSGSNGVHTSTGRCVATTHSFNPDRRACEARHIASWTPAVALAVADWLDAEFNHQFGPTAEAIDVARAYLGESE